MTHTSEPWSRESDDHGTQTIFARSIAIAACVRRNDAARIVACVNACAGLRNSDLAMGVTLKLPRDEERSVNIGDLRAQIKELAGACKALIPWVCKGAAEGAYKGCASPNGDQRAVDRANAALVKARW